MKTAENKRIIQTYFKELHEGEAKTREMMDRYISDEDAELKDHIQVFEAAFPGYFLETKEIIAEDDKVAVSFNFKGTHKAEFMGVPASNKEVNVPGFICYYMKDGMITGHDMVVDSMVLMQQIGAIPGAAESDTKKDTGMKIIKCADLGFDCTGVIKAETEKEALAMAAAHAKEVHGFTDIPEEVIVKIKSVMVTEA